MLRQSSLWSVTRVIPLFVFVGLSGCATPPPRDASPSPAFALSDEDLAAGWQILFAGTHLDNWRGFRSAGLPSGWHLASGALYFDGRFGTPDLITRERYASFELILEWRSAPDANSGILYRVSEDRLQTYATGPEFQVLDAEEDRLLSTGSNYAVHPAAAHPPPSDSARWNEARILVNGSEVEHWRNGEQTAAYTLGSTDWLDRVATSKFALMPGYGLETEGHIALQAHGSPIWFRHIRIRRLQAAAN